MDVVADFILHLIYSIHLAILDASPPQGFMPASSQDCEIDHDWPARGIFFLIVWVFWEFHSEKLQGHSI